MEFKKLVELFKDAGFEPRSYTGRGMGNQKCLGVRCDNSANMVLEVVGCLMERFDGENTVYDVQEALDDLIDDLKGPKQDSMGMGSIIYWPSIPWEEDGDAE